MPHPGEDRSDAGGAAQFNNIGPVPLCRIALPHPSLTISDLSRFAASMSRFAASNIGPVPLCRILSSPDMSLSGTDGCQHAGPTNRIPESQPSGQQTQTDSRSRHTIKRSFRPSDQVSSTPYLPSPVSPFHGEPLFSRSASVWPLGQGASSRGQKKFPAMFESTSTVPLELSLILLTQCIGDAALARASTSASRPVGSQHPATWNETVRP